MDCCGADLSVVVLGRDPSSISLAFASMGLDPRVKPEEDGRVWSSAVTSGADRTDQASTMLHPARQKRQAYQLRVPASFSESSPISFCASLSAG